jgi:hypothetical protein
VSVWAAFQPADIAPSTLAKKLCRIERLYTFADETLGAGRLDDALATFDFAKIAQVAEACYMALRNRPNAFAREAASKLAGDGHDEEVDQILALLFERRLSRFENVSNKSHGGAPPRYRR